MTKRTSILPRNRACAAALARRAASSWAAVGSKARRFTSAHPTYCVLASSRRSGPGALDEGLQIVPEERLAPREVELDDPELLGLAKHAAPVRRVEPVRVAPVVHGVRAVHAAERAPVRQLGDERIRTVLVAHGSL